MVRRVLNSVHGRPAVYEAIHPGSNAELEAQHHAMSLSLATAIKQYLESTVSSWKPTTVSGCPWFRDRPDATQAYPYGTISEGLAFVPSSAAPALGTEMAQVDIWQTWQPTGPADSAAGYDGLHKENPLLGPNITRALHLAQFECGLLSGCSLRQLTNSVRIPDLEANNVHTALTLYVRRIL